MKEPRRITTNYSYSAAVEAGDFVFLGLTRGFHNEFSGQLDDTLKRMQRTLNDLGMSLANLVKVNVWLRRIEDLPEMEKLFRNYFEKDKYPARMTSTTDSSTAIVSS